MSNVTSLAAPGSPTSLAPKSFDPQNFWPKDWDEGMRFANMIAKAPSLLPEHIRTSKNIAEEVFAHVLHGFEIGLSPMQSLKAVYIVKGKSGLYAADQVAIVRKHPDCEYLRVASDPKGNPMADAKSCTWETKRRSQDKPDRLTFTMAEAEQEGLVAQNPKYKSSPVVMLRWRAATRLLSYTWGDVLRGMEDRETLEAEEKDGGWAQRAGGSSPPPRPMVDVVDGQTGEVTSMPAPATSSTATSNPVNVPTPFERLSGELGAVDNLDALGECAAAVKAAAERKELTDDERKQLLALYATRKAAIEGKA